MWRFEDRRAIVVAGRDRAELWSRGPDGFRGADSRPLTFEGSSALPSLGLALKELFKTAMAQPTGRTVHVVLESAWLPAMGLELGDTLWTERKLQALLRHRLGQFHGPEQAAADWILQLEHRAGDALALGYGLAGDVKAAVLAAATATQAAVASIQPAFAWGMDRWLPAARRAQAQWWLWCEQDRTLVAHVQRGRVSALNPAAALVRNEAEARALVARESIRLGADSPNAPAWVCGWRSPGVEEAPGAHRVVFAALQPVLTHSGRQEAPA